jgi:hypothetical protein
MNKSKDPPDQNQIPNPVPAPAGLVPQRMGKRAPGKGKKLQELRTKSDAQLLAEAVAAGLNARLPDMLRIIDQNGDNPELQLKAWQALSRNLPKQSEPSADGMGRAHVLLPDQDK